MYRSITLCFSALLLLVSSTILTNSPALQPDLPNKLSGAQWQQIIQHIHYAPQSVDQSNTFRATNPAQQWNLAFTPSGLDVTSIAEDDWQWGLHLKTYGRADQLISVSQATLSSSGQSLTYQWDSNLQEIFDNRNTGLKQDFILQQAPPGSSPLILQIETPGSLLPKLNGNRIDFYDAGQQFILSYSGLYVFDATGQTLPARFNLQQGAMQIEVDDAQATYPLTVDPFVQQAHLKASNPNAGDSFGQVMAISGNTLVVGAPYEKSNGSSQSDNSFLDAGAVYVFTRSGSSWSQQQYLKASNTGIGDQFGYSVAIDGDTLVVGAIGESSNGSSQSDDSASYAGAAYVFTRSGSTWSQQQYLKASNPGASDQFGSAVAISGDTLVVSTPLEDSNGSNQSNNSASNAGAAYVFTRSGSTWSQQQYLKASNPEAHDQFGYSVAISGDTLVVGAINEDSNGSNQNDNSTIESGAAYVFTRSGSTWSQQQYLKASNPEAHDKFGRAVAISGDTLVVGAIGESSNGSNQSNNSASNAGATYVFTRSGSTWSQQQYLKASNPEENDYFGWAVSIEGANLIVGAYGEDSNGSSQSDNSASAAGAAYVFTRSGSTWSQQQYLKAANPGAGYNFGQSVSISGDTLVVGAHGEDSATGAAYVFGDTAPTAHAGPDQTVTVSTLVTLDGSASSVFDGNLPLTYGWSQTGGTTVTLSNPSTASPSFTAPNVAGVLTFTLTVTDSTGLASTPDSVTITVTNEQPVANAGADQSTLVGSSVTLNGSASSDPDGHTPLTYAWTQTGGTSVTLSDPSAARPIFIAPSVAGALTFSLTVTDSMGLVSAPDTITVRVVPHHIYLPSIGVDASSAR